MKNILAFADEFGNNSFDFSQQGTHFIVASVILEDGNLTTLTDQLEMIRKKHFQTGEIKSNKVGSNHNRRLIILQEILKLDFTIYAVVVNKEKLFGEGFKYKRSFYKYLNGLIYKELFHSFPNLQLTVDEHGSNHFMRGFKKYVLENHKPNLFSSSDFQFENSNQSVILQLADFIAGTLGYIYDKSKYSIESENYLSLLKNHLSGINHFPTEYTSYQIRSTYEESQYDSEIAQLSINKAKLFIENKKVITQDDRDQINCIKLLLLYFTTYDHRQFIPTKEILKHLQIGRDDTIREHAFRTKVIAKLRDEGVLIASSSTGDKKGYKLPSSVNDLHKFVNHGKSMILPLLSRIIKSRESILLATQNKIDIVDKSEFIELKKLLDNFPS